MLEWYTGVAQIRVLEGEHLVAWGCGRLGGGAGRAKLQALAQRAEDVLHPFGDQG